MKIYTKTGDKGTTSLVGGERASKCCDRIESYGTIDELNCEIGLLITYCTDKQDVDTLRCIQNKLFVVGGHLATDTSKTTMRSSLIISHEVVTDIEKEIDRIDSLLPPLKVFILPGGSRASAVCNVCRTICRRAERCIIRLTESGGNVDENVLAYVNRLSDYFFLLARKLNQDNKIEDIIWKE